MKYINTYPDKNAYNSVSSTLPKPNVGYIIADNEVKYAPYIDYSKEYLTFEALESGTFTLTVPLSIDSTYMTSISYSLDNGETWNTTTINNTAQTITTPTINAGDKVIWKGVGKQMANSSNTGRYSQFSSTGNFNVSGNIMSLLYGDEFANQVTFPSGSTYNFARLFYNTIKLISAENLILPATTLANYCYGYMFNGCTRLTTAPVLPATTLVGGCYSTMFSGCTGLTTAPELHATTLADYCYKNMFNGCGHVNNIKMLATGISATDCLKNWVTNVASSGIFTKAASMTTLPTGTSGIPANWTVVDA